MKKVFKNAAWAIRHPIFAWCWFRHGLPYSSVQEGKSHD